MLGRSVTFEPKSVEKRPQQGNFFELTTPTAWIVAEGGEKENLGLKN